MNETVLELVNSYENRICAVEELIVHTYHTAMSADSSLGDLDDEREKLKANLQQRLARNCSLRRKDFDLLMKGVLGESETRKNTIEEERARLVDNIKRYLAQQKELATFLRQELETSGSAPGRAALDATIASIRNSYQDASQNLFTSLRNFQRHLQDYRREQEEINHKLQRLVERGESLNIEDVRRLEAAKVSMARKAERELRRSEVAKLLGNFKQDREEYRHE